MSDMDKEQALSYLKAQLAGMDERRRDLQRQLEKLTKERDGLAAYLAGQLGEEFASPTDIVSGGAKIETAPAVSEKAYHNRDWNKRMVDEALAIIAKSGRPMSAPEIHPLHSGRTQMSTGELYRLMYNRAIAGYLLSINGAFWPATDELPDGWDISMARKFPKKK